MQALHPLLRRTISIAAAALLVAALPLSPRLDAPYAAVTSAAAKGGGGGGGGGKGGGGGGAAAAAGGGAAAGGAAGHGDDGAGAIGGGAGGLAGAAAAGGGGGRRRGHHGGDGDRQHDRSRVRRPCLPGQSGSDPRRRRRQRAQYGAGEGGLQGQSGSFLPRRRADGADQRSDRPRTRQHLSPARRPMGARADERARQRDKRTAQRGLRPHKRDGRRRDSHPAVCTR